MTTLWFAVLAAGGDAVATPMIFLRPWLMDRYALWLCLPLVVAVAVVYKAIKLDDLKQLPWQACRMTGMILGFMALAAAGLWLASELM